MATKTKDEDLRIRLESNATHMRVTKDQYKKLKMLSIVTNVSMKDLFATMIDDYIKKYKQKEVKALLQKLA